MGTAICLCASMQHAYLGIWHALHVSAKGNQLFQRQLGIVGRILRDFGDLNAETEWCETGGDWTGHMGCGAGRDWQGLPETQ